MGVHRVVLVTPIMLLFGGKVVQPDLRLQHGEIASVPGQIKQHLTTSLFGFQHLTLSGTPGIIGSATIKASFKEGDIAAQPDDFANKKSFRNAHVQLPVQSYRGDNRYGNRCPGGTRLNGIMYPCRQQGNGLKAY
jgi:hypothetical protein